MAKTRPRKKYKKNVQKKCEKNNKKSDKKARKCALYIPYLPPPRVIEPGQVDQNRGGAQLGGAQVDQNKTRAHLPQMVKLTQKALFLGGSS